MAEAELVPVFPGLSIPVAQLGHLLAMKILSFNEQDRFKDKLDIIELLRAANDKDLDRAREALVLIQKRGFNRGRDLLALLVNEMSKER